MKQAFVLILVFVVASAGCFGKGERGETPSGSGGSPPGTDGTSPTSTGTQPPIIDPELLNRTLIQKDCIGHTGSLLVPSDRVRPKVPDAFLLDGPPGMASMLVMLLRCREIVANASVGTDFWYFESSAFVTPRNESWRGGDANRYLIDVRVSNQSMTDWLEKLGLEAPTAQFAETNESAMGLIVHRWDVTDSNSGFVMQSASRGNPGGTATNEIRWWYGDGPFLRAIERVQITPDESTSVFPLQCMGDSQSHEIFGDSFPAREGTVLRYNSSVEFSEEQFL